MNEYPQWVGALTIRETHTHSRVTVFSNSFDCKTASRIKKFHIPKAITLPEAIQKALKGSNSIFLHSRGCWIVTQIKVKYGDEEARKELFSDYCRILKAKYDGFDYLYGSIEAQNEIIRDLKIPDIST